MNSSPVAVSKANLGGEEKGWQQEEIGGGGKRRVKRGERECWKEAPADSVKREREV